MAFGDLLSYLGEQYGLAHQAVKDKLSELAEILGYEHVDESTAIEFSDLRILMEEMGTLPASWSELSDFVAQKRAESYAASHAYEEEGDLQDYYQMHKVSDLLNLAKRRGAVVEQLGNKGGAPWSKVTTTTGHVMMFRNVKGKLQWSSIA